MRRTLEELQNIALDWMGLNNIAAFGQDRLTRLINEAYQEAVNAADQSKRPWNVPLEADWVTITTSETVREYAIGEATADYRDILEVHEPFSDGTHSEPLEFPAFSKRNKAVNGFWVFRTPAGRWYLRFNLLPPCFDSLVVIPLPKLEPLASDPETPDQLPVQFHEVVAYGAAMNGLIQDNREFQDVALRWTKGLADLRAGMGSIGRRLSSARMP